MKSPMELFRFSYICDKCRVVVVKKNESRSTTRASFQKEAKDNRGKGRFGLFSM